MGTNFYKNKLLNIRKDRLDLRDRPYRPLLKSLPEFYPKIQNLDDVIRCYRADNMVLDQKEGGACLGYALATVINYLLWIKQYENFMDDPLTLNTQQVSPQMLYNLARIYDEWDGEDYEGSSCRGAMKGWHKHGVCFQSSWTEDMDEPIKGWDTESTKTPLGAYYRIDKESINDMQSAIMEVGALYVSATIHDGWWELIDQEFHPITDINHDIPLIPYDPFPKGNHAFVLDNALDAWVAVMGVPIELTNSSKAFSNLSLVSLNNEEVKGTETMQKALSYDYPQKKIRPKSEQDAYKHTLVLNSHGRAKHTMIYTSTLERCMEILCYEMPKEWLKKSKKHKKIVLYALGGIKNEKEYMSQIRILLPYFLENHIYPIFLTWKYSYWDTIEHSIEVFVKESMENKVLNISDEKILKEKEALDRSIENHSKKIATRALWREIKEKSLNANTREIDGFQKSSSVSGALYILTEYLEKLQKKEGYIFEIHAIAHSAGSQLLATSWLTELSKRDLKLSSMHLLAPTVSIQESNEYMQPTFKKGVFNKKDIHIYMLDKKMESKDNVGYYSKSMLYLISRALDTIHKMPLLGMQDSWILDNTKKEDGIFNTQQLTEVKKWYKFALSNDDPFSLFFLTKENSQLACSKNNDYLPLSHKNLDKSILILERILKIIVTGSVNGKLHHEIENSC